MARDEKAWCHYCQKVHVGKEELYNLQEDPKEIHDISHTKSEISKKMRTELLGVMERLDQKREANITIDDNATQESDLREEEIIKKRLKQLGYMD